MRAPGRRLRAAILLAGVVASQACLYGSSLLGRRIFLPVDLLASGHNYLPDTPAYADVRPHNPVFFDLVLHYELARRFAASEVRAGRLPLWDPHYYLGAPFVRWEKYSPFSAVSYLFPSPHTLAWLQLAKALLAAVGAYLFFRRALGVGFWAAAWGGWLFPLTAWAVLWAGFPVSFVTAWLPWILLATDAVVRRPGGAAAPALAALSALAVLAGHADVAAQVLLVSGLWALWHLAEVWGRPWRPAGAARALAALAAAWALGLALSSVYWLPLLEYLESGARVEERVGGGEERPPEGLRALPELVLPDVYGSLERGSRRLVPGSRLENASAGFVGIVAALFLAPLAWCRREQRRRNLFWALLALVSFGWTVGLPGLVPLLRLPGLNLLSYNRFVFATGFAILAWAVVGLDGLRGRTPDNRAWFAAPILLLTLLAYLCTRFALAPPVSSPLEPELGRSFARSYAAGALASGFALLAWLAVWLRARAPLGFAPLVGAVCLAELLWFGSGVNPENPPSLYYPRLPALEALAQAPPGRALGAFCLPANVLESHGLSDVRGYDGVDPRRLVELLEPLMDERAKPLIYPWARLQNYTPRLEVAPTGEASLPGALDMLNLRYLIFRGEPPPGFRPRLRGEGYWVAENPEALPRAFVPRQALSAGDDRELLRRLTADDFDPRERAYVSGAVAATGPASGSAEIVEETPGRIALRAQMQQPGLLVLADRWDAGWRATLDGRPVPILRVNHVLRGVELPAGESALVFRYRPSGHALGGALAAVSAALWLAWSGVAARSILAA